MRELQNKHIVMTESKDQLMGSTLSSQYTEQAIRLGKPLLPDSGDLQLVQWNSDLVTLDFHCFLFIDHHTVPSNISI